MTPEDRLRDLLHSSSADPGAREGWEGFIDRARRARLRHRAVMTIAVVGVVAAGAVGANSLLDPTPDRGPRPAKTPKEERERDIEELKNNVRDVEKQIREGAGIAVGGKAPDGRGAFLRKAPLERMGQRNRPDPTASSEAAGPRVLDGKCGGRPGTVRGTEGNDRLRGTPEADSFVAFGGDDVLIGLGGEDYMCGGPGNDSISGGAGPDLMYGGAGDDAFSGGTDIDHVWYMEAPQAVNVDLESGVATGEGDDQLTSVEALVGSEFADVLLGSSAANWMYSESGADSVDGRAGDDVIYGSGGDDDLRGGEGIDTVGYSVWPDGQGVQIDLSTGKAVGHGVDMLAGFESARGSFYNDTFTGDGGANSFLGGLGNDSATGGPGDDYLLGDKGDDRLDGGPGDDTLNGGPGTDVCTGGEQEGACEAGAWGEGLLALAAFFTRRRARPNRAHGPATAIYVASRTRRRPCLHRRARTPSSCRSVRRSKPS